MTRHVAANSSLRGRLPLSRGPLIAVGTVAGIAAVFGANALNNALAANSTPVAPGTNLPNIDVSVNSGATVYARNASLSLDTTSDKNLVSPGTDVTFTHARLQTEASRASHAEGWSGAFDKLARHLSNNRP